MTFGCRDVVVAGAAHALQHLLASGARRMEAPRGRDVTSTGRRLYACMSQAHMDIWYASHM
jgi:hypothetical protein